MIVDAHHHLWDPAARDYPWLAGASMASVRRRFSVADLRARAGPEVEGTVLVQTVSSVAETVEFLATAQVHADLIRGVVGWADLTAPDFADTVARIRESPGGARLVGLRHQVEDEPDPDWLGRTDVRRGLADLGAAGLTYDLLVRAPQRQAAEDAARAVDGVSFVLDHAGKPDIAGDEGEAWLEWLARMAALPRVVVKLSGLTTQTRRLSSVVDSGRADVFSPAEAPSNPADVDSAVRYARRVLDAFGPDRVLFGSDWPVCELAGGYGLARHVAESALSGYRPDERSAVLRDNAIRVYGLDR